MKAYKYDESNQTSEIIEIKDSCSNFELDMDKIVTCASCGTSLPYGDTYCSFTIQDATGFGYGVCRECYTQEFKLRYHKRGN